MSVVSMRYAKALMNLAVKEKNVEEIAAGLDEFASSLADSSVMQAFLAEPKVAQNAKDAVVADLLAKAKLPTLLNTFLRYITTKRRMLLVGEINTDFHELADRRQGRAHALVTVAQPLSKAHTEKLQKRLEALSGKKEVQVNVEVDPSLLGGVVAKIGSTVWDASLRNHLNMIEQSILEG